MRGGPNNLKHGMGGTPTYLAWINMRVRCSNPKQEGYQYYGGRGIRVCERWQQSFENFLADMGIRPDGMSIDRIDNDRNYEPGNCRWATRIEQENNKRSNRLITAFGKTQTVAQWTKEMGLENCVLIYGRLNAGWDAEKAISTRVNHRETHCPRGHALAGDNLVIQKNGQRRCLTCRHAYERRAYQKRKLEKSVHGQIP